MPRREAAPLRKQVVELVRRSIILGHYRPGARLVERVLCMRYAVSRTVIREVLRQLETEGLVTVVPGRGPAVATLTPGDAIALYEAREVLEAAAARLFAERATTEERSELQQRFATLKSAYSGDDLLHMLDLKDDYYGTLLAGARNSVLTGLLEVVHARIYLLRSISMRAQGRARQSLEELRVLTEAAVAENAAAAAEAAITHVRAAAIVATTELASAEAAGSAKPIVHTVRAVGRRHTSIRRPI